MADRVRDAAAWGAVGGLTFLVLVQALELTGDPPLDTLGKFGLALAVAATTAAIAFLASPRLGRNESP